MESDAMVAILPLFLLVQTTTGRAIHCDYSITEPLHYCHHLIILYFAYQSTNAIDC